MGSKWAKLLGSKCDIDPATLQLSLEELSESCYGDTNISKKIIEALMLKCNLSKDELKKFIREVSQNCPVDAKKLHKEVVEAKGKKEVALNAIYKAGRTL